MFFKNKNFSWVGIVFRVCFARCKESGKWPACLYNAIGHELAGNKETGIPWGTGSPVLASPLSATQLSYGAP